MNAPYSFIGTAPLAKAVLLLALNVLVQAQENPPSAPAAAPAPAPVPQTEMEKWIATTDAQWQAAFKRDVTDAHATELEKLKQQYVASLEAAVTKASSAGDLDGVVALRNEQKRFAGTNLFPEQDENGDPATVKQLRAVIRAQIARLEKDRATRTKALHAKYDQMLGQAQTQLTQRQRIEDALLVKAKREEVAASWLSGPSATPPPPPETPPPTVAVEPPKPPVSVPVKPAVPVKPTVGQNTVKMDDRALAAKLLEIGCDVHGGADGKSSKLTSV